MKTFKDLYLNNKLEAGREAYLDFKVGTYLGKDEDGYHKLEYLHKGEKQLKKTKYIPTVPQLPLNIFIKNKRTGNFAEIIGYENFNDKMFYIVETPSDVFKSKTNETIHDLEKNFELLEENPFVDYEEIEEGVSNIDAKLSELKDEINKLNKDRSNITKHCRHDWYKYDEVEVSNKSFEQECVCNYCGEEKINRFSRW